MTAEGPEGSCPRKEEIKPAMKERIGSASKDPVQTQINDQCNMKLKIQNELNSRETKGESLAKQTI